MRKAVDSAAVVAVAVLTVWWMVPLFFSVPWRRGRACEPWSGEKRLRRRYGGGAERERSGRRERGGGCGRRRTEIFAPRSPRARRGRRKRFRAGLGWSFPGLLHRGSKERRSRRCGRARLRRALWRRVR